MVIPPIAAARAWIRLFAEHIDALTIDDCDGGYLECGDDPLWHAVEAIEQQLNGLSARTMAGVAAKAQVALHKAHQLGGSETFSDAYIDDWPGQVLRDLLRLRRHAA